MQGLDSIFKSDPKSVFDIVSDSQVCYYMPAYQRPYSWNKKNIVRLFEDLKSGAYNLIESSDSITFLGTLLTVDDPKGNSVYPSEKGHLPSSIKLVIDGQQRLSTLILILSRFHEAIAQSNSRLTQEVKKMMAEEDESDRAYALQSLHEQAADALNNTRLFTTQIATLNPKYNITRKSFEHMLIAGVKTVESPNMIHQLPSI